MTRTISLIIGIAVLALAAVPTAVGKPVPASTGEDAVKFFYANERATMSLPAVVHDHGDATAAKLLMVSPTIGIVRDHGDATQAKLVQSPTVGIVRDNGDANQAKLAWQSGPVVVREDSLRSDGRSDPIIVRDHGDAEQATLDRSTVPSGGGLEPNSGSELDWSQLAIGFGIGILLATVLGLSLRATRTRMLAH